MRNIKRNKLKQLIEQHLLSGRKIERSTCGTLWEVYFVRGLLTEEDVWEYFYLVEKVSKRSSCYTPSDLCRKHLTDLRTLLPVVAA